ncbi:hypothetical protein P1J78_01820 [Psychromarinibacter sp. C21-152]|uniref:DUF6894 domain-containing protein n=1 Tax=Psychromarinibacter sediminicola TaxID=3033385 RepID=A0AAE3NLG0_9RHOB|nr:hypothetical protein [Psychromarinibacter sediminicola]MDF0599458.1 hypothetical protein [Psychromarinibacter sediminicola]
MSLYFFDIDDGEVETRDSTGQELARSEDIRWSAISVLPELAKDALPDSDKRTFRVNVRDEAGTVVYRATLTLVAEWLQ